MKKKSMLIIAILLMSIGFAAISTTLIINGNANVSENNEDLSVIFTAASIDGKDVYTTAVDDIKKTITFTTSELKTLNQTSILAYEVTNNSSNYDANVSVTCVPKDGTTAKYTSIKNKLDNDATVVKAKSSVNGTLTVTLDKVATDSVTEEYTCKLEFNAVERDTIGVELTQFQKDSWSKIAANVKSGNTSKYNVGDTKEVNLGDLGTHTVRIANKTACTNGETSETACGFIVEFADIITEQKFNSTMTSIGGWRDSELRTYVNETIYNAFPSELRNVISTTKVISGYGSASGEANFETQDKLYLLSAHEIWEDIGSEDEEGTTVSVSKYDTSYSYTKQLDYYKSQGVTIFEDRIFGIGGNYAGAIKKYNGSNLKWWTRSASSDSDLVMPAAFLCIYSSGAWSNGMADEPYGVSPAFRIA